VGYPDLDDGSGVRREGNSDDVRIVNSSQQALGERTMFVHAKVLTLQPL